MRAFSNVLGALRSAVHSCEALVPVALCGKNMLSVIFGLWLGFLLEGRPGLRRSDLRASSKEIAPGAACGCAGTAGCCRLGAWRASLDLDKL